MIKLIRRWWNGPANQAKAAPRFKATKASLRLEALEDRCVPATITVNSLVDDTVVNNLVSLREAITSINNAANANADVVPVGAYGINDTIVLGVPGTTSLTAALPIITRSVVIQGTSSATNGVSGMNTFRVFDINPGVTATVSFANLTVTAGQATTGAGINVTTGTLNITDSNVTNSRATTGSGGGLNAAAGVTVNLLRTMVRNNNATLGDGAGMRLAGNFTINSSTIVNNVSAGTGDGGGVSIRWEDTLVRRTGSIVNSTISNNIAGDDGGGINLFIDRAGGTLNVTDTTISSNQAPGSPALAGEGGGLNVATAATPPAFVQVNLTRTQVTTNSSGLAGGGLNLLGNFVIDSSTISGNTTRAGGGGGLAFGGLVAGSGVIRNSNISGNTTTGSGGGVFGVNDGGVTIEGTVISANTAGGGGGGMNLVDTDTTIRNSTISGNTADTGGGLSLGGGNPFLIEATNINANRASGIGGGIEIDVLGFNGLIRASSIFENSAGGNGGGVNLFTGVVTLENSTVSGNVSGGSGGGLFLSNDGTTTVRNSTIAANRAVGGGGIYFDPALGSTTLNLDNTIVADNVNPAGGNDLERPSGADTLNARFDIIEVLLASINGTNVSNRVGLDPRLGALSFNGGPTPTHALLQGSGAINTGDPNFTPPPFTDQRGQPRVQGGQLDVGAFEAVPPPPPPTGANGTQTFAIGTNPETQGFDRLFNPDLSSRLIETPFPGYTGSVRAVAGGDVDGDGFIDAVVGVAEGPTHVKVISGRTGGQIASFFAFPGFLGGVTVALGDVNADGLADIIVGSATAFTHVKAFSGADGSLLKSFFAFPGFASGATVASGDINADGFDDIVIGTANFFSHVMAFSGRDNAVLASFLVVPGPTLGVEVACGDFNGDRRADIAAASSGGLAQVQIFRVTPSGAVAQIVGPIVPFAGYFSRLGVAAVDLNGDGVDELLTDTMSGPVFVKIYRNLSDPNPISFLAYPSARPPVPR